MKRKVFLLFAMLLILAAIAPTAPASFGAFATPATAATAVDPDIGVNGYFSTDKAQRGRTVQAAIVMDIPSGYHVNSNRPLSKYAVPTSLKIEAPGGIRVGPQQFPSARVRRFKFSQDQLAVYEGRAVIRFNVIVPANFGSGGTELKAHLRFQSCDEEVCYPPQTREVKMWIEVVGANDSVKRVNGNIFGGRKG